MKKFIVAFDGLKFSTVAAQYAVYLAKKANARLTGVFLEDFTYHSYKIYDLVNEENVPIETQRIKLEEVDETLREKAVDTFLAICNESKIDFSVRHARNIAIRELLEESIYADLLIIDRKETLTHYEETIPTRFIRDLFENAQCPILAVPSTFEPIEKAVLLYDGQPNSVFALKCFSNLFASQLEIPVEVFTVDNDDTHESPNSKLLKEFLKHNYAAISHKIVKGDSEVLIPQHIKGMKTNPIVVLGAYQRGMVSRWFHASMADKLLKELNCPLFVAHR